MAVLELTKRMKNQSQAYLSRQRVLSTSFVSEGGVSGARSLKDVRVEEKEKEVENAKEEDKKKGEKEEDEKKGKKKKKKKGKEEKKEEEKKLEEQKLERAKQEAMMMQTKEAARKVRAQQKCVEASDVDMGEIVTLARDYRQPENVSQTLNEIKNNMKLLEADLKGIQVDEEG